MVMKRVGERNKHGRIAPPESKKRAMYIERMFDGENALDYVCVLYIMHDRAEVQSMESMEETKSTAKKIYTHCNDATVGSAAKTTNVRRVLSRPCLH